jgi:cell division protein FtsN
MASELSGRGYSATVIGAGGTFKVQVGAFKSRDKAESVQKELSANGYDASVTP